MVRIGWGLPLDLRKKLAELLIENKEIFKWSSNDLGVIPKEFAEHILGISARIKLVFQKKRTFPKQRQELIRKEVKDLLDAGIIKPTDFSKCLSNLVVVSKGRSMASLYRFH